MKKALFLYGVNCTLDVWYEIKDAFPFMDIVFVEYPHEITQSAQSIKDITKWVYEKYGMEHFDFIIGHSMGGLIALELAAEYKVKCNTVIFIESNLRPAKEFYRNLMLPSNMDKFGEKLKEMFLNESTHYSISLKSSIQEDFDFTPYINEITCKIVGIYGDRGIEHYSKRIEDLCLDKQIEEKINFKFIKDSCHMPMIENPQGLIDTLMECFI